MLDKFTRLTYKLLRVLNAEYALRVISVLNQEYDATYNHGDKYKYVNIFSFNDSGIYSDTKMYISESSSREGSVRIFYTLLNAFIRRNVNDKCIDRDIVSLYIDIIRMIFDKYLTRLEYRALHIDNSAEDMVDELLEYSDEELGLYIKMI